MILYLFAFESLNVCVCVCTGAYYISNFFLLGPTSSYLVSVCISVHFSVVDQSVCLSVSLSICLSVCLQSIFIEPVSLLHYVLLSHPIASHQTGKHTRGLQNMHIQLYKLFPVDGGLKPNVAGRNCSNSTANCLYERKANVNTREAFRIPLPLSFSLPSTPLPTTTHSSVSVTCTLPHLSSSFTCPHHSNEHEHFYDHRKGQTHTPCITQMLNRWTDCFSTYSNVAWNYIFGMAPGGC